MSAPPFMPLYIGDYLSDTRHLSTEQHGAYLLLLMAMWRAGGRLPNEGAKLARICGLSAAKWAKLEAEILAFFSVSGDEIGHKRIEKEFEKYTRTCAKRAASGAKGGKAKSLKNNVADLANATILLEPGYSNQNQNQKEGSVSPPDGEDTGGEPPTIDDPNKRAWGEGIALLIAQGAMTEAKARGFFGKLLRDNQLEARDLLGAMGEAFHLGTADPQGYLTRAAQARGRRKQTGPPKRVGFV